MTALDAILDGFESALELERELGNRIVPCDRKLLAPLVCDAALLTLGRLGTPIDGASFTSTPLAF